MSEQEVGLDFDIGLVEENDPPPPALGMGYWGFRVGGNVRGTQRVLGF